MWIWKDEQLHAEFVRGALLRAGGLGPAAVVYGRQLQGALSGWTSATSNHRDARTAPFRAGAAGLLVAVGAATGQVPPVLRRELRYQTFRHYCRLNVALEASAELAYRRLVEAGPPARWNELPSTASVTTRPVTPPPSGSWPVPSAKTTA